MTARELAKFCLYLASYGLAYRFGMSFSQVTASPFWFPDSVLLCALLLTPGRSWWLFVLGALTIRLVLSADLALPLWFLIDTFAIDSAKGVVTALVLRHCLEDALRLRTVRDFAIYCLVAVVLVPAAAALLGAGARFFLGHDFWGSWRQWFLGNALTNLVITPAILYGLPGAERSSRRAPPARWVEGLCVMTGLTVAGYIAFYTPGTRGFAEPQFYAPVPFLFWAALRFGIPGASGGITVIAILSVSAALRGEGPFAGRSPDETAFALQEFLLLRALPLYLVGILTEQKEASEARRIKSEQRYREIVESQTELVCRFLADGTLSFVSEAFCRAFHREREALVGSDFMALMLPQTRDAIRAQVALVLRYGRGEWECQVALPEGKAGWQHWVCHVVGGTNTQVTELQAIGRDITDRKRADEADRTLSGKLIEAQEQERARIARELHDDINQRLASASIDVSAIRRHTDERPVQSRARPSPAGIDRAVRRSPSHFAQPASEPAATHRPQHGTRSAVRFEPRRRWTLNRPASPLADGCAPRRRRAMPVPGRTGGIAQRDTPCQGGPYRNRVPAAERGCGTSHHGRRRRAGRGRQRRPATRPRTVQPGRAHPVPRRPIRSDDRTGAGRTHLRTHSGPG
jgi:PAS domain S-box-containing protein